jgi:predicted nucleic acid-binding protein
MMFGAAVSWTVSAVTGESSGGYLRLVLVTAQAEGHCGLEWAGATAGGCALRGDSRWTRRNDRQELLSGISDNVQFERLRSILDAFADEPITTAIYVEAARLDNLCRKRGVQCGEIDMLLCATALHYGWTILTSDAGLLRCIQVVESDRKDRRKLRE